MKYGKAVLKLRDPGVREVRERLATLLSPRPLTRGTFSALYPGSQPDRVRKLSVDPANYAYLTSPKAPQGVHKPVVHQDYGQVGTTATGLPIYLLEVEKLEPLTRGTAMSRFVRNLSDTARWYWFYWYRDKSCNNYLQRHGLPELETIRDLDDSFAAFLTDLLSFLVHSGCRFDGNACGNYLLRSSDGCLVASDPVHDPAMLGATPRQSVVI